MKNDLISRQMVIDAVHEEFDDCLVWDESGKRTADEFEIIINRLPSAQPERKTGRWLTSDDMYETGVCSVCKCDSQEPVSYTIMMFKYCPNCGAKMEKLDD